MPIKMRWIDFDFMNSGSAPNRPGVFELADTNIETTYVAGVKDVNDTLMRMLRAGHPLAKGARFVRWEAAEEPEARQKELLEEVRAAKGKLPQGNETGVKV